MRGAVQEVTREPQPLGARALQRIVLRQMLGEPNGFQQCVCQDGTIRGSASLDAIRDHVNRIATKKGSEHKALTLILIRSS